MNCFAFLDEPKLVKIRFTELFLGYITDDFTTLACVVLIQYKHVKTVTDRQTDRHADMTPTPL